MSEARVESKVAAAQADAQSSVPEASQAPRSTVIVSPPANADAGGNG